MARPPGNGVVSIQTPYHVRAQHLRPSPCAWAGREREGRAPGFINTLCRFPGRRPRGVPPPTPPWVHFPTAYRLFHQTTVVCLHTGSYGALLLYLCTTHAPAPSTTPPALATRHHLLPPTAGGERQRLSASLKFFDKTSFARLPRGGWLPSWRCRGYYRRTIAAGDIFSGFRPVPVCRSYTTEDVVRAGWRANDSTGDAGRDAGRYIYSPCDKLVVCRIHLPSTLL